MVKSKIYSEIYFACLFAVHFVFDACQYGNSINIRLGSESNLLTSRSKWEGVKDFVTIGRRGGSRK